MRTKNYWDNQRRKTMETTSKNEGIKWDDNYLLGNEQVDNQHRKLFELVNSLVESCDSETAMDELRSTLNFLLRYTVQHFEDEEALQIRSNFPEYEQHKKMHEDFKVTVRDLVQRFIESNSSDLLLHDVKKILVKWLINHILEEDKKIGRHLAGSLMA